MSPERSSGFIMRRNVSGLNALIVKRESYVFTSFADQSQIALSLKNDVPYLEMFQAVRTILAIFGSEKKPYIVCVECVQEKRRRDANWQLTAGVRL
jgi:hypothetical protein